MVSFRALSSYGYDDLVQLFDDFIHVASQLRNTGLPLAWTLAEELTYDDPRFGKGMVRLALTKSWSIRHV